MKNIQVIDGASNCAYDIFKIDDSDFKFLFPGKDQNIEFIEDVDIRDPDTLKSVLGRMWLHPVRKDRVQGIHGILFFQLERKKQFYPKKQDQDLDLTGRAFSTANL